MHRWIITLAILLIAGGASAQISPGPLSAAHEHLDGMRQCRSCHGGGDDGLDQKCLECHRALEWTIQENRGLHSREGRQDCANCHPEHAGRDFELVDWGGDRDSFDHSRAGWSLSGSHANGKCGDCHQEKYQHRNVLLRRPDKSGTSTFLGLDRSSCVSCHATPHSERLGLDCTACHDEDKWMDVPRFDHDRTGYPLTDRHVQLDCAACHRNGRFGVTESSTASMHYAPISFDECAPCHKDPHSDRFGALCSSCHVTTGFKNVSADRFEHARTRFPLREAHATVTCDRCHDPALGGWGPKPAFDRCGACHQDAHAGSATLSGQPVDCNRCHGQDSFKRTTFDLAMHSKSAYPLLGRHEQLECATCHRRDMDVAAFGSAGVDLRPASGRCRDCHADDHAGQFSERYEGGACESCHTVEGWIPSTFGAEQHASTRFALEGAHITAECRRCHGLDRSGLEPHDPTIIPGKANVVLPLEETRCSDCHVDVHRARYQKQSCADCHEQSRFVPSSVGLTEHNQYSFKLDGAHRATPCFLCHKQLGSQSHLPAGTHALISEPAPPDVILWEIPSACQACHRTEVPK